MHVWATHTQEHLCGGHRSGNKFGGVSSFLVLWIPGGPTQASRLGLFLTGLRSYISNKSLGDKVLWFGSRVDKQTEKRV